MRTLCVEIKGIVQGVGFRPHVYNLAIKLGLRGWVNNDEKGVNIHLQGLDAEAFIQNLQDNPPPLAQIDSIDSSWIQEDEYVDFSIHESQNSGAKSTTISPDMAVCSDCVEDIFDEKNFRYHYALTNCTNCGPRYSIINTVPYDRCNTSMHEFELCSACDEEYKDPSNRRYHAQPVACESCGPELALYNHQNEVIESGYESVSLLASLIKGGEIVALKGLGGFHLICDATNDEAVLNLRERKNRPTKPFAVLFKSLEQVKAYANLTLKEERIVNSKEKPITLLFKTSNSNLSKHVAPKIDRVGCFIAYTPLHYLLFEHLENPIVATSANLKDEPIIRHKDELIDKLGHVVNYVLDFNREIINACDDSVVQVIGNELSVLRNARGYAPTTLKLPFKVKQPTLALGANQKSTIALAFEDNLILSPHIGDLGSINSIEYFERTIETFKRFYDFEPKLIVCDQHPLYESVKWAKNQDAKLLQVQHHYAHVLSCMAEYNLRGKHLSFAFDGTGYGDDGTIWGGEVFLCDETDYKRVYHLEPFKLLGGEKAVKEPKRVGVSLLFEHHSFDEIMKLDNDCVNAFTQGELKLMYTMWQKGLNAPLTSSMGRLFDAVASLSGLAQTQSYEGETGLLIEQAYDESITEAYSYEISNGVIKLDLMIKEMLTDKESCVISSKFLNMLSNLIVELSLQHKEDVILTGGVFQNRTLCEKVMKSLRKEEKRYYVSSKVPLNDGGLSMGQIFYSAFK